MTRRATFLTKKEIEGGEEVEIKVKINPKRAKIIRQKIIELRAVPLGIAEEKDSYFTAPHRNFLKTKECLRIREKNGRVELTYKGPTTKQMFARKQFWKHEVNLPIDGFKKEIETLLELLNFRRVADVVKQREKFLLGSQTITLDNIKGLGWFMEVEKTAKNKKERQRFLKDNINLVKEIGLKEKDIIVKPYRDLLLERKTAKRRK